MEHLLKSEIARVILGYLQEEHCDDIANEFLESSSHLIECLELSRSGEEISTRPFGKSLKDMLKEYCILQKLVRQKLKTLPKEMESRVRKYSVLEQLKFLLLDNSESNVSQLCQKGKYVFKNDEVLQSEQKKQELATSVEYPQSVQPSPENFSPPLCEQIPHDNIEVTSQLLQNKLNKEISQMECEHPGKNVKKDGCTDNEQPLENQQNDMLHNIEANEKMIQSADTAVQRNEMEQFMHHQESVQNKQYLQDEGEEPMRQNEWNMPSGTDEHLKEDTGAVDISVLDVVNKQTEILNVVEQAVHNEEIEAVPNNKQIVGKTIFIINDYRITRTEAPPLTRVTPQVSYRKYEVDIEKIKHHVKCVAPDISKHELHMIYDVFRYDVLCHNDDEDDRNWRKKHDDKNDDGSVGELTNHSCTVSGSSVPRPLENAVLPLKKRNTTSYNLEDSADIDYHDRSTDSKLICEQQIELVTDDSSQDILLERVNILSPKHAEVFKNTFDKSSSQTKQNSTKNINISFASDPANEENTTSKERNYDDTRKQFEKEQTPRGNHKKFVSEMCTYSDKDCFKGNINDEEKSIDTEDSQQKHVKEDVNSHYVQDNKDIQNNESEEMRHIPSSNNNNNELFENTQCDTGSRPKQSEKSDSTEATSSANMCACNESINIPQVEVASRERNIHENCNEKKHGDEQSSEGKYEEVLSEQDDEQTKSELDRENLVFDKTNEEKVLDTQNKNKENISHRVTENLEEQRESPALSVSVYSNIDIEPSKTAQTECEVVTAEQYGQQSLSETGHSSLSYTSQNAEMERNESIETEGNKDPYSEECNEYIIPYGQGQLSASVNVQPAQIIISPEQEESLAQMGLIQNVFISDGPVIMCESVNATVLPLQSQSPLGITSLENSKSLKKEAIMKSYVPIAPKRKQKEIHRTKDAVNHELSSASKTMVKTTQFLSESCWKKRKRRGNQNFSPSTCVSLDKGISVEANLEQGITITTEQGSIHFSNPHPILNSPTISSNPCNMSTKKSSSDMLQNIICNNDTFLNTKEQSDLHLQDVSAKDASFIQEVVQNEIYTPNSKNECVSDPVSIGKGSTDDISFENMDINNGKNLQDVSSTSFLFHAQIIDIDDEVKNCDITRDTPDTNKKQCLLRKKQSFTTPRRGYGHIRALDFNTPLQNLNIRKSNTSPKANQRKRLFQKPSNLSRSLFSSTSKQIIKPHILSSSKSLDADTNYGLQSSTAACKSLKISPRRAVDTNKNENVIPSHKLLQVSNKGESRYMENISVENASSCKDTDESILSISAKNMSLGKQKVKGNRNSTLELSVVGKSKVVRQNRNRKCDAIIISKDGDYDDLKKETCPENSSDSLSLCQVESNARSGMGSKRQKKVKNNSSKKNSKILDKSSNKSVKKCSKPVSNTEVLSLIADKKPKLCKSKTVAQFPTNFNARKINSLKKRFAITKKIACNKKEDFNNTVSTDTENITCQKPDTEMQDHSFIKSSNETPSSFHTQKNVSPVHEEFQDGQVSSISRLYHSDHSDLSILNMKALKSNELGKIYQQISEKVTRNDASETSNSNIMICTKKVSQEDIQTNSETIQKFETSNCCNTNLKSDEYQSMSNSTFVEKENHGGVNMVFPHDNFIDTGMLDLRNEKVSHKTIICEDKSMEKSHDKVLSLVSPSQDKLGVGISVLSDSSNVNTSIEGSEMEVDTHKSTSYSRESNRTVECQLALLHGEIYEDTPALGDTTARGHEKYSSVQDCKLPLDSGETRKSYNQTTGANRNESDESFNLNVRVTNSLGGSLNFSNNGSPKNCFGLLSDDSNVSKKDKFSSMHKTSLKSEGEIASQVSEEQITESIESDCDTQTMEINENCLKLNSETEIENSNQVSCYPMEKQLAKCNVEKVDSEKKKRKRKTLDKEDNVGNESEKKRMALLENQQELYNTSDTDFKKHVTKEKTDGDKYVTDKRIDCEKYVRKKGSIYFGEHQHKIFSPRLCKRESHNCSDGECNSTHPAYKIQQVKKTTGDEIIDTNIHNEIQTARNTINKIPKTKSKEYLSKLSFGHQVEKNMLIGTSHRYGDGANTSKISVTDSECKTLPLKKRKPSVDGVTGKVKKKHVEPGTAKSLLEKMDLDRFLSVVHGEQNP